MKKGSKISKLIMNYEVLQLETHMKKVNVQTNYFPMI